jgi:hypothetical protein
MGETIKFNKSNKMANKITVWAIKIFLCLVIFVLAELAVKSFEFPILAKNFICAFAALAIFNYKPSKK